MDRPQDACLQWADRVAFDRHVRLEFKGTQLSLGVIPRPAARRMTVGVWTKGDAVTSFDDLRISD